MACFWRPNTCFRFACRSVSYYSVLKIYFAIFISKRKRNTLKGFVIRSSWKKQFVQQREMPKRAMSAGKRADRSFSFSSKTQEWNSFAALFPICRKNSRTAMSDSAHGPRSSGHAGRKFHLPWWGWNRISCDYKLMLTLMSKASGLMIRCSNEDICNTFELRLIMIMSINFVEWSCWER